MRFLAHRQDFVKDLNQHFALHQSIKLRIIKVDAEQQHIIGSIKRALAAESASANSSELENLEVGAVCSGTIAAIHREQLLFTLSPSNVPALLSFTAIASKRQMAVDVIKTTFAVGEVFPELHVVSKNVEKGIAIVSLQKASTRTKSVKKPKTMISDMLSIDTITVGQTVEGTIAGQTEHGFNVRLARNLKGRLHFTDCVDDYDRLESVTEGASIRCKVLAVDTELKRVDLSSRESVIAGDDQDMQTAKDPEITDLSSLTDGQMVRGFVKNISSGGLFVAIGRNITARVLIKELFDDYVKDWQSRWHVGQLVEGKVLRCV